MQKIEYFTCVCQAVRFFCSSGCEIKLNIVTQLNIHSINIDYKDFMKVNRECTKEQIYFFFLAIDTTLPASDSLSFGKNLFYSYKNCSS